MAGSEWCPPGSFLAEGRLCWWQSSWRSFWSILRLRSQSKLLRNCPSCHCVGLSSLSTQWSFPIDLFRYWRQMRHSGSSSDCSRGLSGFLCSFLSYMYFDIQQYRFRPDIFMSWLNILCCALSKKSSVRWSKIVSGFFLSAWTWFVLFSIYLYFYSNRIPP